MLKNLTRNFKDDIAKRYLNAIFITLLLIIIIIIAAPLLLRHIKDSELALLALIILFFVFVLIIQCFSDKMFCDHSKYERCDIDD